MYWAVSKGLHWLSNGKIDVQHRELRAEALTHLQKHKQAYDAPWDHEDPSASH